VSWFSDYLRRLRAERQEQSRQEELSRQRAATWRQEQAKEHQRRLYEQDRRERLRGEYIERQRAEQSRQAAAQQQRRTVLARILAEQRREETQELPRPPHEPAPPRREGRQFDRPARGSHQRDTQLATLRTARAEESRRREAIEEQRARTLLRAQEELRRRRSAEAVNAGRLQQLRAARQQDVRERDRQARGATLRNRTVREAALERRAVFPVKPRSGVSLLARPASVPLPSAVPEPVIEEGLSWLSAQGSFVVDENGNPVPLRGVTVVGLDAASPLPGQTLADALALDSFNIAALADGWGVNLVRIPFMSRPILSGNDALPAAQLLSDLDDLIAALSASGCYVLLAMSSSADEDGGLPAADDYACWRALAIRYQDEPTVLYEVFSSDSVLADSWLEVAQTVIGTIRREHTASLLFVGNGTAAADVRGFPLRFTTGDPVHNLVYTIRLTPQLLSMVDRPQLETLANAYPVFASQWSDGGADFGRASELASALLQRYGIGWASANWNAAPRLVVDAAAHRFAPTRWGLVAQRALALPVKPMLTPFGGAPLASEKPTFPLLG
jgi:hypothetical protein